jgi:hypothetical protein
MTDQSNIASRQTGPALDPDERPAGGGKRWAILIGFAVVVLGAAASVNHRTDKADEPPAAAAAKQEPPGSTNAVLPPGAAPTKSGG